MKLKKIASLIACILILGGGSHSEAAQPTEQPHTQPSILNQRIPRVNLEDATLIDTIDFLHDCTAATIVVNWKSVEGAGVRKTTKLNLNLRNVKLSTALRVIIEAAGGKDKLAFEFERGVITISTIAEFICTKTYDIRDLFPNGTNDADREKLAVDLLQLIKETIDAESWGKNGKSCVIDGKKGQVTLTQTGVNQTALENLIRELRKLRSSEKPETATKPSR